MIHIDKRIIIPVVDNTSSERLLNQLKEGEKKGVKVTDNLRKYIFAGFQLQEIGGGIIDAWLGMEENGELKHLSKDEKAQILINMLDRISGNPSSTVEVVHKKEDMVKNKEPDPPKPKKTIGQMAKKKTIDTVSLEV